MSQKLKNKVAVVTGGGSGGIGRAISMAMAEEGASVVVNDISRDNAGKSIADAVVQEITKAKGKAVANYDSVATMQGGQNIIKTAISNFGRIDILVNCAGNNAWAPITEITEEQWDSVITVHLKGHFICCKAAAMEMVKQKSGRIINFSSIGATFGVGGAGPSYSAAKAGILGLTASISEGLQPYGITVNAILPSAVTKLFPQTNRIGAIGDHMPVSPWLDPEYIAPLVVYLATDEAKFINGRFIHASGGDFCVYAKPFMMPGDAHLFVRKMGKWTVDELHQAFTQLLQQ